MGKLVDVKAILPFVPLQVLGLVAVPTTRAGKGFTVTLALAVALWAPLTAVTLIVKAVCVPTIGALCVNTLPEPENPVGLLVQVYVTGEARFVGVAVKLT